jgi:hypothetical protein
MGMNDRGKYYGVWEIDRFNTFQSTKIDAFENKFFKVIAPYARSPQGKME